MPDETSQDSHLDQATVLLNRIHDGDADAVDELLPIVYEQLRAMAGGYFRGERANHTLQPTALVHEAFIKLIRGTGGWESRSHFYAVAARAMRQILSNHAAAKQAAKRRGQQAQVTVDHLSPEKRTEIDPVELNDVLDRLELVSERYARIVEMRCFAGLTVEEVAHVLGLSRSTVESDWRGIRMWLNRELG